MIQILQKSLDSIGKTSTIRSANNTIHDTMNNEIDKLENKSNLLNLDADAKPVSFTSSKNGSPSSIQVVLRTEEISKDKSSDSVKDVEPAEQNVGPWVRIGNLFAQLWKNILSLFSK